MIDITDLSASSLQALLDAGPGVDASTELICSQGNFGCDVWKIERETDKALLVYGAWFLPRRGSWTGATTSAHWIPKSQIKERVTQDGDETIILKKWFANKLSNQIKASL